jgi:hypothetical protein
VIQVLLGHSKLETTSHYAQVATNLLRTVTSPLDHRSGHTGDINEFLLVRRLLATISRRADADLGVCGNA